MNKTLIIAKREYLAVVKRKSFWLSTLLFPVLLGVLMFISGYTSSQSEQYFNFDGEVEEGQEILILDQTNYINQDILSEGFSSVDNLDQSIEKVKDGEALALIFYPEDILEDNKIIIYQQGDSITQQGKYTLLAQNLLKQSILTSIEEDKALIINSNISVESTVYNDKGEEVNTQIESLIVPGVAIAIYFVLVTFGTSFLLSSVSEEKESRMIEIIMSTVRSKQLIFGKLIGILGIVLTQAFLLATLSIGVLVISNASLPFNLSDIEISVGEIVTSIIYIAFGFIIIANLMIGVGASQPTLKEAQSFSSIFILGSMLPIYFITLIIADPNGELTVILSHAPLTGPIVMLFRNAVTDIPLIQIVTASISMILQVIITFVISYKLFEFGSLEVNNAVSLREFFRSKKM